MFLPVRFKKWCSYSLICLVTSQLTYADMGMHHQAPWHPMQAAVLNNFEVNGQYFDGSVSGIGDYLDSLQD